VPEDVFPMIKRKAKSVMDVRRNFSGGGKSTFRLSFSGCWPCNANGRSQNALPIQHHKENAPCYGNNPKKCAWLAAMLLFHSYFFSHCVKLRGLLLSGVIVSLHILLSCHKMSAISGHMRQNVYCHNFFQKCTFVGMWLLRNKDQY